MWVIIDFFEWAVFGHNHQLIIFKTLGNSYIFLIGRSVHDNMSCLTSQSCLMLSLQFVVSSNVLKGLKVFMGFFFYNLLLNMQIMYKL